MENILDQLDICDIRIDFWFPKTILDKCENKNHDNIGKRITDVFEIFEKGKQKEINE